MDNGRHNAIFSNPEVDDNLNEENWQKSLEISAPSGLPTPEQLARPLEEPAVDTPHETGDAPRELGQITKISTSQPEPVRDLPGAPLIKTTGDYLDKASLTVIDDTIAKLDQTGDLSDFYDVARNMTEVNLNNSFNRKLGHNEIPGATTGEKS